MTTITRLFIAFLLVVSSATTLAVEESPNNKGMFIQRTIEPGEPQDGFPNGNLLEDLVQQGGMVVTPGLEFNTGLAPTEDTIIAYWMRRQLDDANSAVSSSPYAVAASAPAFNGVPGPYPNVAAAATLADEAELPADGDWHYFVVHIGTGYDEPNPIKVYRDNLLLKETSIGAYRRFSIVTFGAELTGTYDNPPVPSRKNPTIFDSVVDDVSVWTTDNDADLDAVLQIHTNIYKYGMAAMPESDDRRLSYFNCDSSNDALDYYQDSPRVWSFTEMSIEKTSGEFIENNVLQAVTNKPIRFGRVTVESEFGADKVSPVVQASADTPFKEQISFSAPASVYLDRYFNELQVSDGDTAKIEKLAYYRADCIGYDVDGPAFQGDGSLNSFVATLTEDITVVWKWELKYLIGVDSATGSHADAGLDPGSGAPNPAVGFHFEGSSSNGGPARAGSIAGSIGGTGVPARFRSLGYILENTPGATDRSLVLSGNSDHLRVVGDNIGHNLGGTQSDFTIDFWARRDPVTATEDQAIITIGDPFNSGFQIGFGPNTENGNGFSGNRFFIQHVGGHIEYQARAWVPEAFSDHEWHHWAVVYTRDGLGAGDVQIYRDGSLLGPIDQDVPDKIAFYNSSRYMSIGGYNTSESFAGGVNNLRVWKEGLSQSNIQESMKTESYGEDGDATLLIELGFDEFGVYSAESTTYNGYEDFENSSTTIPLSVDAGAGSIVDRVTLVVDDLRHTENLEFKIELTSPTGTKIVLVQGELSDHWGRKVLNFTFDDSAAEPIGSVPYDNGEDDYDDLSGTYRPREPLAAFVGEDPNGDWQVTLTDTNQDPGTFGGELRGVTLNVTAKSASATSGVDGNWTTSSTEGNNYSFSTAGFDARFPANTSADKKEAALFPGFIYVPSTSAIPPDRVQTPTNATDDWWRVTWLWEKQYRLDISAVDPETQGTQFAGQPFVSGDVEFAGVTDDDNQLWVSDGATITVGSRYRDSNCHTLRDVLLSTGSLESITWESLVDSSSGAVSRQVNDLTIVAPGTVTWQYDKTIFRAEIALGNYLDVADMAAANLQLVPDLCGGAILDPNGWERILESTPDTAQEKSIGNAADGLLFDKVNQRVWPVRPGRFRVEWGDSNFTETYVVEIIADYPTNVTDLTNYGYWRENEDGSRQGSAPDYVTTVTMPGLADAFPASPRAHYNHLATNGDKPPTDLDASPDDRWHFDRFTSGTTTGMAVTDTSLTSASPGRGIMVWTYAADPATPATGDLLSESYLVRVVESADVADRTQIDEVLSSDRRQVFSPRTDRKLIIGTPGDDEPPEQLHFHQEDSFSIDFWSQLTADTDTTAYRSDMRVFAFYGIRAHERVDFSVGYHGRSGSGDNEDAGRLYVYQRNSLEGGGTVTAPVLADNNWHHWTIVYTGQASTATIQIFRDGALVAREETTEARLATGGYQASISLALGASARSTSDSLDGKIDNFRIWGEALSQDELREAMTTRAATLTVGSAPEALLALDWDGGATGTTIVQPNITTKTVSYADSYTGVAAVQIPDGSAAGTDIAINVSGIPAGATVVGVTFSIDGETPNGDAVTTTNGINHMFVGDLSMTLTSPTGTVVELFEKIGLGGNNISNLLFDDAAGQGIQDFPGSASPLTGTFRPKGQLADFIGEIASGAWTFNVSDTVGGDMGDVRGLTLNLIVAEAVDTPVVQTENGESAADVLTQNSYDGHPEIAARIRSKLDGAGFDSGYLLNAISNYNAQIYNRQAAIGTWGAIYPTNWAGLFTDANRQLDVAYYENFNTGLPAAAGATIAEPLDVLHPAVDWPSRVVRYANVDYPDAFPIDTAQTHNRIYVASRLGTEGYSNDGVQQRIFEPGETDGLSIYNQPDRAAPGFNPNEEHAIVANSIQATLTGTTAPNIRPKAAFSLQSGGLNQTNRTDDLDTYSSDPWVLVQYLNLATDELEMAAYKVEETRSGAELFPRLDADTHSPKDALNRPVPQPPNPTYDFDYPIFAGDLVLPPYPLNLVVGAVNLGAYNRGGNIKVDHDNNGATLPIPQRTVWKDINKNNWCVSGNGRFFFENWYPLRSDFWFDQNGDGDGRSDLAVSTPIAWLPSNGEYLSSTTATPVKTRYSSYWDSDYPILKRGETVTFAGGENRAENANDEGLPAVLAWASGQVVYDDNTPTMALDDSNVDDFTARLIRPLDRHEAAFTQAQMETAELTPAETDKIMVISARWYFKELDGSLQKRFYYDSLLSKLVFRGRVNNKEGGNPDLTETPVSLSVLEPNVMTKPEYLKLLERSSSGAWKLAVTAIYEATQNPHAVAGVTPGTISSDKKFWAGVQDKSAELVQQYGFYSETDANGSNTPGTSITSTTASNTESYQPLNSLGVGAALVPNPALLAANPDRDGDGQPDSLYVTLAENNHPDAGGAISIHIIEIGPARYRGAIKMIEAQNVFDEKINLQHTADFGANTDDVYYQWWRREVVPLDEASLPVDEPEWQVLEQGLGLHKIEVAGNPAVMLADSLFFVRYGEKSEFVGSQDDPVTQTIANDSWRLVDFQGDTWLKTGSTAVPYQYAGAFNSPQLQADGSKRYIPQLVMGWVKRVLDRVNPYEARYSDFYSNESPATYSSQIQIAGGPYNGKVALNADKDVIENVGLIELYETVLARAKELTLDTGAATDGTNQALLLAATRLATLYELLAREAYSDAQNPTVPVTTDNGIAGVGAFVHAFENQEPDLLHEELALLRGTDFLKAYPAQNRLFWNYVKGLGEAAYNAVYNIHDENEDGFINEFDAAKLYPQGHGDAWGHFVSANNMHYELLNHGNSQFSWRSRAELYSLLDNVIEADYLDEKTFARIAAAKARAGKEIVAATYRQAYTDDPDGQWQGYTDSANPARAWGVSEWSKRAGQGAYFDWIVGNALVPDDADAAADSPQEGLDDIDRRANLAELAEIAAASGAIQRTLDDANAGHNPLGFDNDAIAFDIDPSQIDAKQTHFEQIYARAVTALRNADASLAAASTVDNQIRSIANDSRELQIAALRQDIDYRNRLIELFGTPYDGKIGPGQIYAEGYTGPDMLLYAYVDRTQVSSVTPVSDPTFAKLVTAGDTASYQALARTYNDVGFDFNYASALTNSDPSAVFAGYQLPATATASLDSLDSLRVDRTASYAFLAQDDDGTSWGKRGAYGQVQMSISEMLAEEVAMRQAIADYEGLLKRMLAQAERLRTQLEVQKARAESGGKADNIVLTARIIQELSKLVGGELASGKEAAINGFNTSIEFLPRVNGFSNDVTSSARGALRLSQAAVAGASSLAADITEIAEFAATETIAIAEANAEGDEKTAADYLALQEQVNAFAQILTNEVSARLAIAEHTQRFNILAERLQSEKAEGFRLLKEREAFNMVLASKAQRNRYGDMIGRITRNESLTSYNASFDNALKFAWLAAKAYDYETSLDPGDPAAATSLFDQLVRTRSIGQLVDGAPQNGQGGIAEILAQMNLNFTTLKGQLGINNPQLEVGRLSVRRELMRIGDGSLSDANWRKALLDAQVDDLWQVSEFRQYCRPFADPAAGAQPGIVLEFGTEINSGFNVFGQPLGGGDHAYSSANYATKIRSLGVWFENYNDAGLATTPRVYLVPVGMDVLRLANSQYPTARSWNVVEQKVPVPFLFNTEQLGATNFLPKVHTLNGSFADLRRFGDFRAYHDSGGTQTDMAQMVSDSRLIGRSVWNTRWLLIIPAATLHANKDYGIEQFIDSVRDVRLQFETYSHQGN